MALLHKLTRKPHGLKSMTKRVQGEISSRPGQELPRFDLRGRPDLEARKLGLVGQIGAAESIRDFGGLWKVHGRYLLEGAVSLGANFASMIDITPRTEFSTEIEKAKERCPGLDVEFVQGDFRDKFLYRDLIVVEVSLLYAVLLHQENAAEVIRNVCSKTRSYICVAQPCLREDMFPLPYCELNLIFLDDAVKDELRKNTWWPKKPEATQFKTGYWIWGHTTSCLIGLFKGFGWKLHWGEIADNVGDYWEHPFLVFKKE